jgi:hypothetical protein
METSQDSVESQLHTRFSSLESQVETLEKQQSKPPEKLVINDDAQAEKRIIAKAGESEYDATLWDKKFEEDVKSGRFFGITNISVVGFKKGHFEEFWAFYEKLPKDIQGLADNNFALLKENPEHSSLYLKAVGRYWSIRIGEKNRALGVEVGDKGLLWCWIGSHAEYDSWSKSLPFALSFHP